MHLLVLQWSKVQSPKPWQSSVLRELLIVELFFCFLRPPTKLGALIAKPQSVLSKMTCKTFSWLVFEEQITRCCFVLQQMFLQCKSFSAIIELGADKTNLEQGPHLSLAGIAYIRLQKPGGSNIYPLCSGQVGDNE
jgi:hypothetical protein